MQRLEYDGGVFVPEKEKPALEGTGLRKTSEHECDCSTARAMRFAILAVLDEIEGPAPYSVESSLPDHIVQQLCDSLVCTSPVKEGC